MTIERQTHLYEILIRLGPDGFQGAHVIDLERVTDGGEVLAEKELAARPVTEAEVGKIIGAEAAKLIEAADTARAEAEAAKARVGEAEARQQDAQAKLDAAGEALRRALESIAATA